MKLAFILCSLVGLAYGGNGVGKKIWTIAIGHDWSGHEYIDTSGYLTGFHYDLIAEVCEAAGMECRTMWLPTTECWKSVSGSPSYGGRGLLSGWTDACTAWIGTINRMQVFDFSMPFSQPLKVYFYVKKNGATFDTTDISGKKIGFIDGFFSDDRCLARQNIKGVPVPKEKQFHYPTSDKATEAILSGEVDAVFVHERYLTDENLKELDGDVFMCASGGACMMTRKDNDFNAYWNRGFQQILSSGRFSKLCKEAMDKHGHKGVLNECV